ncbi:MAG: hypothetical protein U9N57_01075 [Pseudomonadota bacterium]|nr:hypothetical protein [Pseudomonadota bacterium]
MTTSPKLMPTTCFKEVSGHPKTSMPTRKECREVETVSVTLKNGETIELAVLFEPGANSYFGIETSYIEQEAGKIVSPYKNGQLTLVD